jgi:hypothetical protein
MTTHSNNTLTFEELTYSQQASSISAQILSLERAIIAHERRALEEAEEGRNASDVKQRNIEQVQRMLERLSVTK